MNRSLFTLLIGAGLMNKADAQRVVYDKKHFQTVNENAVSRQAAELTHNQYLEKVDQNLQNINLNIGSVLTAQSIIYNALSNVNSALKNGRAVLQLGTLVSDMLGYSAEMLEMARSEPYLLLFAEDLGREMKMRSARLVSEVSGMVLHEGTNLLADFNSRDQLLRHVIQELQLLSSLAYGGWKAMFWARQRGMIKSLNPFQQYLDDDRAFVDDIIRNARYLKNQ